MGTNDDSVPISELAEMGVCERKIYLRAKYGARTSKDRQAHQRRGEEVHLAAYQQSRPDEGQTPSDKRCFIASCVYGADAPKTNHLRHFRDSKLRRSVPGRLFIRTYYLASPHVVKLLVRVPALKRLARRVVDRLVELTGGPA